MIRFFSGNNPLNVLVLFFLGIIIKLPYFITPVIPNAQVNDGFLYIELLKVIKPVGDILPVIYPILAFLLLFTQSITFNSLLNGQKLFSSPNFLVAFSYLVISSIVPEWNTLSPVLIINTILVWAWPRMVSLYNHPKPQTVLFNIGFGFGICSFFYFPSFYLLLLLIAALISFRPFYITEWIVAILGILTPFYFLLVYFFVWDQWEKTYQIIPKQTLTLPVVPYNWKFWLEFTLIVVPLIIGVMMSLTFTQRMIVHVRKSWNYMNFYLLIALFIPFINSSAGLTNWILALVPISLYHASFSFFSKKKTIPEFFFWISLMWIISNFLLIRYL